jgi:two-component sensor histidine kinase
LPKKGKILDDKNSREPISALQSTKPSRAVSFLYAAMVALTLGIATFTFVNDYQRTQQDIETRAEAYAISMATDVRWYVDVARQTLRRTADRIQQGSRTDISDVVSDAISDLPDGVVVAIYDADGSSRAFLGAKPLPVNIKDRPYFQDLQSGRDWVFSNVIADRVTHTKTFAIGLALRDGDIFTGAVVAYAPMNVFRDAWLKVGGERSNAFIVHREGWITARLPAVDSEIYDTRLPSSFTNMFKGAPTGSYWAEASPIDGVPRVVGFATVPSTPLVAAIGLSPEFEISALWRRVLVSLAILAPILFLLGYASWRIRKLIHQQEATALSLSKALATNEKFLLEIHHRVKNNLQSALSLIRLHVKSPEIMAEIEPRITAMAKVHEHIYRSDDLVSVAAPGYLTDIAEQIIFTASTPITLKTEIADVQLPSDVAMPVGQLLNEAIINAVKYGFTDKKTGTISINLSVDDHEQATLTVHNNGLPFSPAQKAGIGSRLMPAFAQQINGVFEMTSDENGVTVQLKFPLPDLRQG